MPHSKIEKNWNYQNYHCIVKFTPLGHRCGYVGLPKGCLFVGDEPEDIPVDCHGGITYAKERLHDDGEDYIEDPNVAWWIGFDCAHYGDAPDYGLVGEYFGDDEEVLKSTALMMMFNRKPEGSEIRSLEYCVQECENMVNQLILLEVK